MSGIDDICEPERNLNFSYKTLITDNHLKLMMQVMEMIIRNAAIEGSCQREPVIRFRNPEHLRRIFPLDIDKSPCSIEQVKEIINDIILFSAKPGHPRYFYQFSGGLDMYGLLGSLLTDALMVNTFTYKSAPLFTLMEKYVLKKVVKMFGFPEESEGIFCPGGSLANGFAMNLARYYKFPEIKQRGMPPEKCLILFISEHAHYSMYKMASFIGLGEQNVIAVRVNKYGVMDLTHLRELFETYCNSSPHEPFILVATAGTTVLGVYDPLEEMADLCAKYRVWFHVDAAWGGTAIFSDVYKKHLTGIHKADSFVWNPSKSLAIPQQCSILCVRHPKLLKKAHSFGAAYLFQNRMYDSSYDLGDSYLQCGRKSDVLKLWLTWKAKGHTGMKNHVNALIEKAEYLTNKIKKHPNFKLVCEPAYINVCFWYIPDNLKRHKIEDIYQDLDKITPKVEEKLLRNGTVMINTQPLQKLPNFFRFICSSSSVKNEDCDYLLREIQNVAQELDY